MNASPTLVTSPSAPAVPKPRVPYNAAYTWSVCLVAALGGLLFGYDWVVISGADLFYEKFFGLTDAGRQGWAKSCALVGCLIGAVLSGGLSDKFGRRRLLLLAAFLFAVSSLGTGLAKTFNAFVVWRILGGAAIGLASNLSPMYIAELAPAQVRGKLVSVNQLTIVIGILLAQLVNWLISEPVPRDATADAILHSWNGQSGWRWMFAATAVPSLLLFLVGMLFVPESPRWLVRNGQRQEAQRVLARLGGAAWAVDALAEIETTLAHTSERVNFRALLEPRVRRILCLGVVLAFLQQWCGINVIFYYAKDVFAAAGCPVSDILLNIVIIGLANLSFTFVALHTVDRQGRRFLMLAGWAGLAGIYLLLGAGYFFKVQGLPLVVLVVSAIACYACTLAPVTWVVLAEIFPNRIRGAAMSIAVFALWTGCFTLTYTFPLLHQRFGAAATFWTYAVICVVGFWFCRAKLPETKGKTLEQIEHELLNSR
ncbi:MAG: sugar porter family MFS transporter [Verrucomicrobia bacterium]|nr:sugar porter family MFS transporter [Verrucomicrobiota bacterium]